MPLENRRRAASRLLRLAAWSTLFALGNAAEPGHVDPFTCRGYGYGGTIDSIYEQELASRLQGQNYLDYTGSGVYLSSQVIGLHLSENSVRVARAGL